MPRNKRGEIRVLEALLASAIIFSALLAMIPLKEYLHSSHDSEALSKIGFNVLIEADKDGSLGKLISERKWSMISDRLSLLLPVGVAYNLTIYNEDIQPLGNGSISSSWGSTIGNNVAVQFLLADENSLRFYMIRLQLAWMT
jgi:hypothetical protein